MIGVMGTAAPDTFPQAVIMDAARSGAITFLGIDDPAARLDRGLIARVRAPALAVVAAGVGPGRVREAHALRNWTELAIVHAIREDAADYAMILDIVLKRRRVLLIETTPSLAMVWITFLREQIPRTFGWVAGKGLV